VTGQRPGTLGEELCFWPAWQVALAIRERRLSAREYLDALLARIERHNAGLRLVVTLDDRARSWARSADDATVHGRDSGPLHGVAMTVKDSLATEGLRTTAGSADLAWYVPRRDAEAVGALRRAGAIIFGKTNLAEHSADVQSRNGVFGQACNPWQPEYTTGGSSGGSAGAVAAGFSPLELGSDLAGSIRIPAADCGVLGHKPSFGIVPMTGHIPPYHPADPDLAVVGPIGRCTRDLELALDTVAAPSPWDSPAWRVRLPPARPVRRVAAWFDDPHCSVDDEVRNALHAAAGLLAGAGVVVHELAPPGIGLAASDLVARRLLATAALARQAPTHAPARAGSQAAGAGLGEEFVGQSYADWAQAHTQRTRLRVRWARFFTDYDAILLPVAPNRTIQHDHRPMAERRVIVNGTERPYWDQIAWACLTGVCYLPSTVLPVRLDSRGLPIGIAVAGPYLGDRTTLAAARVLTELLPPLGYPQLSPPGRGRAASVPEDHRGEGGAETNGDHDIGIPGAQAAGIDHPAVADE
jgi:amidase